MPSTPKLNTDVAGGDLSPSVVDRLLHNGTTLGVAVLAAAVYLATLLVVPRFASWEHLTSLVNLTAPLGIVVLGAGLVILGGGIDLSVPNVITASGILASSLVALHVPSVVVVCASLFLGGVIGLINGLFIAILRIPALIVTLAVGGVVQGVVLMSTGGTPQSGAPEFLERAANGDLIAGFSGQAITWFVLLAVVVVVIGHTSFGRSVYAVGTNARVAALAGMNTRLSTMLTYVICALLSALAGLFLLGFTGISVSTMGDPYLLAPIAAVVLGGTSILGGRGTFGGMAAGAFLLMSVESLLTVVSVPEAVRQILEGIIILIVLLVYGSGIGHRSLALRKWGKRILQPLAGRSDDDERG